ncbi:MAG: phage holin family protein, partial [Chloroflexi bacterium]|nr:phage holin family protein [Chloroflexota bacterium]
MSLLHPIRDTWAASVGVARERLRVGGRRRILLDWVVQAAVLMLVGHLVPGILVESAAAALFAAVMLGLLNALVRPVIILLTLPLNVVTVGLLSLVVNAMMLTLAAPFVPGFEVTSFAGAFAAALVITVLTTLISVVVSANRDDTFYAELARRLSSLEAPRVAGGKGLLIVQIDGLGAPVLRNAIRVGLVPRMASWVRSGRYRLVEWDCAPPSQTPSSQAGILHGSNDDIPAFRWYEKERGRLMVANRPADAAEIERRLSDGRGLLAADGVSVGNLFSGDAARSLFTMSAIGAGRAADVDAFSLYFVDPAALVRTLVL